MRKLMADKAIEKRVTGCIAEPSGPKRVSRQDWDVPRGATRSVVTLTIEVN
jgi:hypothetical protein